MRTVLAPKPHELSAFERPACWTDAYPRAPVACGCHARAVSRRQGLRRMSLSFKDFLMKRNQRYRTAV